MLKLENIDCGYGKKRILQNVNLSINSGEITCILGENGAGKSTLFKTILGLLPPLKGSVSFNDVLLNTCTQKDVAKIISYVPQAHGAPFNFTVFNIVLMGQYVHTRGLFSIPTKKNKQAAKDAIQLLGIGSLSNKIFSKLSGGEKQMVLIARAIAQQPRFIAMDEPTSNLDMKNQAKVMEIVDLLKQKGFGIIMNTHVPEQAFNYADQIILLKDGKVRKAGTPQEIMNSELISEIYNTKLELADVFMKNGENRKVCIAC